MLGENSVIKAFLGIAIVLISNSEIKFLLLHIFTNKMKKANHRQWRKSIFETSVGSDLNLDFDFLV